MKKQPWMKDAVATTRGWVNPKTGELLASANFTEEQVAELNGETKEEPKQEPEKEEEEPEKEEKKKGKKFGFIKK